MLDTRKDAEVVTVRLENVKLKNKLKKQELQLKSKVCSPRMSHLPPPPPYQCLISPIQKCNFYEFDANLV